MNYIKLAWRNIWRNKKRTLITVTAIVVAVVLSALMTSMQEGTYSRMIDNVVKFYSGYIQVQDSVYWESKSIDDTFEPTAEITSAIEQEKEVLLHVPRLESAGLLSTGDKTRFAALIGIDPEKEAQFTHLSRWINKGDYLKPGDDGIILAVNIADYLNLNIDDTVVILSQGYHGYTAAGLFPVRGILEFPSPQLNSFAAYIDLSKAQEFFTAPGMVTSIALLIQDQDELMNIKNSLSEKIDDKYVVKTWQELQPELVNMIDGDRAGGVIMKAILYLIIGFGILGTIIMMMAERRKENGILVAIGMQKVKMIKILFYETLLIGMVGVFIGFLLSFPVIALLLKYPIRFTGEIAKTYEMFGIEPILFFSMDPVVFFRQAVIVLVLTIFISLYPVFKVLNMNIIKSLRG